MQDVQKDRASGAIEPTTETPTTVGRTASDVADWHAWFDNQRAGFESELSNHLKFLKSQTPPHSRLFEAVEYSLAGGGKRLRPVLALEASRICGGNRDAAWPAALAIECIHTFSLIHDDLPAMDDDDLRRGKPTSHKVFGEALAVLAGDWLVAHAFDLLASEDVDQRLAPELVRALARGTRDMIIGQGADIAGQERPTDPNLVDYIHQHKTARLLEAACKLGAISARTSGANLTAIAAYGHHLGLAFQISDDLLDRTGTTANMGKRVGKDAKEAKQTYPAAFGVEESRRRAQTEIEAAVAALKPFGADADHLRDLAGYVIARDH